MRLALFTTILLLWSGCQGTQPSAGIDFSVDDTQYVPGEEVQLRLVNGIDQMLGYNLCFSDLERQQNDQWQIVPDSETVCTTVQYGLEPGDTATFTKMILNDVPRGTYRYHTRIELREDERQEDAVTDPFQVGK